MDKGRFMELTGLNHGVDSALPQFWLNKMSREMQLDYDKVLQWYVWDCRSSPSHPVNLAETFVDELSNTMITLTDGHPVSVLDLIETLLAHPEEVTITIK